MTPLGLISTAAAWAVAGAVFFVVLVGAIASGLFALLWIVRIARRWTEKIEP